jgi:glucose/arabinose dehydrogenase/PKD repeat protein
MAPMKRALIVAAMTAVVGSMLVPPGGAPVRGAEPTRGDLFRPTSSATTGSDGTTTNGLSPDAIAPDAVPAGFTESIAFSGLTNPTSIRFASDGRVFVAEKGGLIKVFSSITATTPTVFADLRTNADDYWDRGLLGMTLDPAFPSQPYVYVLYTYDAALGATAPRWNDACPSPPGPTTDGCVVSGRLSRLTANGNVMTGSEQVLVSDWCQQYPSHSQGELRFGPDGMLYATSGDGASFTTVDYGQFGGSSGSPTQKNPCGDPPAGAGGTMTSPTAEGGALRSQDLRTPATPGTGQTYRQLIVSMSPVAHWRLGETSGTSAADSSGTNTGTYSGGFTLGVPGLLTGDTDKAVQLNGTTGQVAVANAGALNPTAAITVAAWGTSTSFTNRNPRLVQKGITDNQYRLLVEGGRVVWDIAGVGSVSAAVPSLNARHFYAGTYDRANLRLYIDGSQVASTAATAAIPTTTQPLAIGNKPTSTDARDPWPGVVDEVSIHNVALSAAQVSQLWSTGSNGPGTGTGDPTGLDGSLLRLDPATGVGASGNPLAGSGDANERRILAHGFRNPFRFTFRPGTSELWIGDVGWNDWEEVDRITTPTSGIRNFGWPCYEGNGQQPGYASSGVSICQNLYATPSAVSAPYYTYNHASKVVAGEGCPTGSSSITGMAFYQGGTYPASYANALFFADYSRNCIWVMKAGSNGLPDPNQISTFVDGAAGPVALEIGPGGDLFYVDMNGGTIRRIRSTVSGQPPTASIAATPTSGQAPLTVQFDGTGSSDPENGALSYAWDLDGDGALDDSTAASPSFTYSTAGTRTVRLQVTDPQQLTGSDTQLIDVTGSGGGGQTYAQLIGSMSPVAYWRLGETSGSSAADSAGSTTGTYAGGVTLGVGGLLTGDTNRAVQLNGTTGQVTVPNTGALNPTNAMSIAGWFNATSFTSRNPRIFQKGVNDTQYRLLVEGGQLMFHIAGVGTVTGPLPSLNARHFVVGTYDRTSMRLYLDGAQVGQAAATAAIPVTSEVAAIGNKPTSTDARDPFPGVLDEVSIHNVALSAGQVGQLWTTGTTGSGGGTNTPPVPVIDTPAASVTWKVGDTISFTGHATDAEDGTEPASRLSWSLILEHCPSNCHTHNIQSWPGVASGSFQAPDHDYPSDLLLTLTATDSAGTPVSTSVRLDPKTVVLSFGSSPSGLQISVNAISAATPFTKTVIQGSANTLSAPTPQTLGATAYTFSAWSDGGAASHTVTANAAATYTATYTPSGGGGGTTYRDTVLADGPVGYWRLGEATGAFVDSIAARNGTASGTITRDVVGPLATGDDGGIKFGASADVAIPHASAFAIATTGHLSIEGWVRDGGQAGEVISKSQGTSFEWSVRQSGDGLALSIWNGAGADCLNEFVGGGDIGGGWHHFVYTIDQPTHTTTFYLDGQQVDQGTAAWLRAPNAVASSAQVHLGRRGDNVNLWPGSLDEVAIYSKVLTPAQVAAHYTAATTP